MVTKKETIKAPTKKELTDGSKQLKKKHSSGARVMADESVAVRQGTGMVDKSVIGRQRAGMATKSKKSKGKGLA